MAQTFSRSQPQVKVDDGYLIALAKQGDPLAYNQIVKRYYGFVRLKASSYFLAGGDSDDLIQEGLVGLYKAVRDFRSDRESSFRNFAELCITRARSSPRSRPQPQQAQPAQPLRLLLGPGRRIRRRSAPTLDELIAGPAVQDPASHAVSSEELRSLVACLSTTLSELEANVLSLYLDGYSYEQIGERLECDTKTVDNALQRVKRKVGVHLDARMILT